MGLLPSVSPNCGEPVRVVHWVGVRVLHWVGRKVLDPGRFHPLGVAQDGW